MDYRVTKCEFHHTRAYRAAPRVGWRDTRSEQRTKSGDIIKDTPLLDDFVEFEGVPLFYFICVGFP